MAYPSVTTLAAGFRSGQLRIADYLSELEARFAEREPQVFSFVPEEGRFDRLRREADQLLARFPDPSSRPPLFGVPVGVKDIFHVSGFVTRAGSRLPPELLQGPEADSVTVLKNAGASILGKTVTTEFAYFGPGLTRNPHNAEHTPGGSSSGSAAAVAAGLCPLTLGTQTIGSIIRPASFCGVTGFKPSYERISRAGVIPLSPSLDHVGVFARDVAGVALAASVSIRDWKPNEIMNRPALGTPDGPVLLRAGEEMLAHFRQTCSRLAAAGYEIKWVPAMRDFEAIYDRHFTAVNGEAARVHKDWFPRYRDLYHPKTVERLEQGQTVSDEELAQALKGREQLRAELHALMDQHGLDVWISPSAVGPAPKGLESTGDPVMNLAWTQAGMPSLNLPSGSNALGLPLGLQLTARLGADESLLAWAAGIEAALHEHKGDH